MLGFNELWKSDWDSGCFVPKIQLFNQSLFWSSLNGPRNSSEKNLLQKNPRSFSRYFLKKWTDDIIVTLGNLQTCKSRKSRKQDHSSRIPYSINFFVKRHLLSKQSQTHMTHLTSQALLKMLPLIKHLSYILC